MSRYMMRSTRRRANTGDAVDGDNVFALIDEYEEENDAGGPSNVHPEVGDLPKVPDDVVLVDDSSDGEEMHDPMAHLCPCRECRIARRKGKMAAASGKKDPHLKCYICLSPTVQGGKHFACALLCGHVYGKKCIDPWLKARTPPTCPVCNRFNPSSKIITLYAEGGNDETIDDDKIRAEEAHIREGGLRQKIASLVELTNVLYEGMKLYAEVLSPVACLR